MIDLARASAVKIVVIGICIYAIASLIAYSALDLVRDDFGKWVTVFVIYVLAIIFFSCAGSSIVNALHEAALATP